MALYILTPQLFDLEAVIVMQLFLHAFLIASLFRIYLFQTHLWLCTFEFLNNYFSY